MAARALVLALLGFVLRTSVAVEMHMTFRSRNPVRKVINMLQAMSKKVEEEGKKEQELFDKFTCYCDKGKKDLGESITASEAALAGTGPAVEAGTSKVSQAQADVQQAKADRQAAQDAIAGATALRQKEAAAFAAEQAETNTNIDAIGKAIAALEKGNAASFLQSQSASTLRRIVTTGGVDMADEDRQNVVSFLSDSDGYEPQSGEIVGILKQIKDQVVASRDESVAAEEAAIKSHEELTVAKGKEVEALTVTIEAKMAQIGELGVAIEQQKGGLADAKEALEEDKKFLQELEASCAAKAAEWEERKKMRAEELVAIADTIKILNDDDALELFKSTLPGPAKSFLQVQVTAASMRGRALAAVRAARSRAMHPHRAGIDFLVLALNSKDALKNGGFEKITAMIDTLAADLGKEQKDDDDKKDYCVKEFGLAEDKKKELEVKVSDAQSAIGSIDEAMNAITLEIGALQSGIRALDASVAEATKQRQAENAEYKDLMANNGAAKELLGFAKNRLNKFYNPKLYKPEADKEPKSAASFVQVSMRRRAREEDGDGEQEAPPPPPETFGAYTKKSEETGGVIQMVDVLISDLEKEMVVAETEEKSAQADYEELMKDSQEKRVIDAEAITQKEAAKADMEATREGHTKTKDETAAELAAKVQYITVLHTECDWLLQHYDIRKEARTDEIDALNKAKAVLSGADFSFVQISAHRHLRHSPRRGASA